ncbi:MULTISPECIES: NAD(P)/FAD-dependent oxidoreductase [unclassified Bacillus (in: firmicutes)]|uniref:phytoene desaturase family protein n=1 Tax=unclassified Bacillus (in: firmicutes) TaxID=185979 RepID=UPI0008DF32F4|nr:MULTISPECIES: FAD-dependent oxidoreductase [unclassified Bacillus (in: firmicutes)]SFA90036.1 Phytoene dehydrogenase-related protein [Bacillus sp. UNCCL13]SFQ85118.1 Phytoene dehydrogenase-related protein [Bacillus sp. cl95]
MKKVIVVGAGLGGLFTAGLLAGRGHQVTVVERSPILGGRSHVLKKDGFTLSYGAHAILAPKAHPVSSIFKELNIHLKYNKMSLSKFKLFNNGKVVSSPLGPASLTSPAINGVINHFVFFKKFIQMVKAKPIFDEYLTVESWINQNIKDPSVAKVIKAYATLSVYDGALDCYSMNAFVELANCEYSTLQPLAYASYQELLEKLKEQIMKHNGTIHLGCKVQDLVINEGKIVGVKTNDQTLTTDTVIINLPPHFLEKIVNYDPLINELSPILKQTPQFVYVYDLMLSKSLRRDITNILDLDDNVYINDYTLNVPSSVTNNGQLLSCLKFLTKDEQQDDQHAEKSKKSIERILDHAYPGWREHIVGTRIINRAMVNGIARHTGNQFLPFKSKCVESLFFVGDSTAGRGGLALPSYDSAWAVTEMISKKNSNMQVNHI